MIPRIHPLDARQLPSLPDEYVRAVLGNPPSGPKAVAQASYSAQALEADRRVDLRTDLMRQIRQKREELERLEAGLRELDILEGAT